MRHAAYAKKEDVAALLGMLKADPSLLLQAGNVITPGGDEIRRVTIYEFLLGAGDYELAKEVQGYFSKIEYGEPQRIRQYERYKPHIDGMLTQKPYDLEPLIELIKKSTPQEVATLLNKDFTGENDLCKAIIQFRKDWAPRVLVKPRMHYNYVSLQHALELFRCEWHNLHQASGNNYDKICLVWRQLIGFEMRRMPGIDRCIIAQGLFQVIEMHKKVNRSYKFNQSDDEEFPIVASDDSLDGLGGDFAVNLWGSPAGEFGPHHTLDATMAWKTYVEQKHQTCAALCSPSTQYVNRPGV